MLWDDIISGGSDVPKSLSDKWAISNAKCFEITNIYNWAMECFDNHKDVPLSDGKQMFPPPSEFFFLESNVPNKFIISDGSGTCGVPTQFGILCGCCPMGNAMEARFSEYHRGRWFGRGFKKTVNAVIEGIKELKGLSHGELVSQGKYFYTVDIFRRFRGSHGIVTGPVRIMLDRYAGGAIVNIDKDYPEREEFAIAGYRDNEVEHAMAAGVINMVYLFLLFLNTKNITIQIFRKPEDRLNRARERRGKLPLSVYKVLTIDPNKIRKEYLPEHGSASTGFDLRHHFCRGHFKSYGENAPLLGKHTGTWFWTPQMRGSKKLGEVHKSYKVLPAKTDISGGDAP